MPYHKKQIPKGTYGEFSKITEEYLEFEDAFEQGDKVLQLCELSDLLGAIEAYTLGRFNVGLLDLIKFSNKTKSTFIEGSRK